MAFMVGFFVVFSFFAYPVQARAFSITEFFKNLFGMSTQDEVVETNEVTPDPQTKPFPFLSAVPMADPNAVEKNSKLQFIGDTALASAIGPLGNVAEAAESSVSYRITSYTVHKGDTLPVIAKSFGVSVSTLTWANNISRGSGIKEGDVLVILPVSGVKHTVVKGDTITSIAKKYGGDPNEVVNFNDLNPSDPLAIGSEIIVPDGEIVLPPEEISPSQPRPAFVRGGGPDLSGYFTRPIFGGRKTTGIHGFNAVDLAAPRGTPVYAAAGGVIITARSSGWNGGYGQFIAIAHSNGTQTLYAHLSSVDVSAGTPVYQGQPIGKIGSTGKSTGSHLHFEVRGAKNPF